MSDSPSSATAEKTSIPENEETAIPVTAETSTPGTEVNSTPVTGETAITATEENSISVVEETPLPVPDETATPEREETSIPKIEQDVIPTTEVDNDESKEPELVPDPEDPAFKELRQLLDDFHPVWKRSTEMANATYGVVVFFVQVLNVFYCLWFIISGVICNPLVVGLTYFNNECGYRPYWLDSWVASVDLTRYLIVFAIMLGGMLVALHSWSVYVCQDLFCHCVSRETLDLLNAASCRWVNQRFIIDLLMIGTGISIVIFNECFLCVLIFFKP
ncbi:uncharacterized protein LOC116915927 isoform X1 [Daphnia magna]|uniref:uncharacterized protein LOC116915927 isoform X1 n=1 Tax=Daphnia magna TaxID=35525 RepID=UPI001E1BABFC|nr:uncharacterized protein LOC116915927 isoform X1 [Daphnia magna]